MALIIWIIIAVIDLWIIGNPALLCYISLRRRPHDIRTRKIDPRSPKSKVQAAVIQSQTFFKTHPAELIVMEAAGESLCARRFRQEKPVGRLILFHGYRSIAETDFGPVMAFYYSLGYELILVDQRAHGKSSGIWIGFGVLERYDCLAWIRYLNEEYGSLPTYLSGISMGCATVLMTLGFRLPENVKGVIADCGFTSPKEIIRQVIRQRLHLPGFLLVPCLSLFSKIFAGYYFGEYSTLEALKENQIPILFIHGKEDRFVPPEMTLRNFEACRAEKQLLMVEGASHGTAYLQDRPGVERAVAAFLEKYRK